MKFICIKENLEKVLSVAERFIGKNLTLPILGNILLEHDGITLKISATNLEYAFQAEIPGKSGKPGKLCVPAKIFNPLIQSLKDEKIELEEKQMNLIVTADARRVVINGVLAEDFPLIPKIKKISTFAVDSALLQEALAKVLPAVSSSEFKPELTGVYLRVSQKEICLAATDTFRLAEKRIEMDGKLKGDACTFILPFRIAQELVRILPQGEDVSVSLGDNQVLFEMRGIKIISRLIEGNFPEYGAIIPKEFEVSGFFPKSAFVDAVRSSSIFSSKLQDVSFHFYGKGVEISSANADVGEFKTTLNASVAGKELAVSFNYRYLLDGLTALHEEEFFFGLNGENKPSLLRNKADGSLLYVLMPIRLM
ncbi:MAG: polymerase III subunit beta protein [Parcubacteria group bacterium GW2011_GWA2_45_30]|nr:MAG: polymerase III subunit beta protein [Parcubacteria group bacterium GW2011_GWA2_45_30]